MRDTTELCDTTVCVSVDVGIWFLTEVLNFLFDRKDLIRLAVLPEKFNFSKSYNKPRCQAVSKAIRYNRIPQQWRDFSLKLKITWSLNLHILRCRNVKCTQAKLNSVEPF